MVEEVTQVVKELYPDAEVYVFGSVVEGRVTPASDIDVLVVVSDNPSEAYLVIAAMLEDKLGEIAYLVDLHVVGRSEVSNPPYKWWLKRAVKVA